MTEFEKQVIAQLQNINAVLANLQINGLKFGAEFSAPCIFTFGEWLLHWQEKYKQPKQSAEVYKWNLRRITNKIIPNLGNINLVDLTTDNIQDYLNSIPPSNSRDKLAHILNGSLRKAYDLGHIPRNPYKAVETVKTQAESYPVFQPHQQLRILRKIDNKKYLKMFLFYCCTGFRLNEGLSINPQKDIDRKRHIINLDMPDRNTKKHKRSIPYLPSLLKGFDLSKTSLFPDITANGARQYFYKLFKRHDIDGCFHSFRHTFISCCYHIGILPKYIQEWAGHKSILMTLDTYTHILEGKNTPILEYLKKLKKALKI